MRFNCSESHELSADAGPGGVSCEADGKFFYCVRYPCGPDKMYNTCGLDALCRLRHPHLQRPAHIHVDATSCTLLFPVYTGTLKMLLGKYYSTQDKLTRLYPLLSALAFLHNNKICHGNIGPESVMFCGEHAWLCDLCECVRDTCESQAARKDIVDLGHVFAKVLNEDGAKPSARATQLLNSMMDTSSPHTAEDLCYFPAFDHCRKQYCTWLELRPAEGPEAFDEDHRLHLKAFLLHASQKFTQVPLAHLFRAATTAKRCQGVAGSDTLLYCLLFMSLRTCGPLDAAEFCAAAEGRVTVEQIKHLQLPIVNACDGVLWTNHAYDACLNKDQAERAYFGLLLSYDVTALANVDPESYGQFLGPAVRCVCEWTQGDVADLEG